MQLYSQCYPENYIRAGLYRSDPRPPVIIIPGLFGSTSNWRSFARNLGQSYPVIVVDQRNHGRSPHSDSNAYADLVLDLLTFINRYEFSQVIPVGHSMGGKVAMVFSLEHPERVAKLVVLDIAPVTYSGSHAPFLEALQKIDLSTLASRSAAEKALRPVIPDAPTRLFLLQSLSGKAGSYRWRLNLSVLHQYMPELVSFPIEASEDRRADTPSMFIFAEDSDYVNQAHHEIIYSYFKGANFKGIDNAGHWLHVEQPDAVLDAVLKFIGSENNE